MSKGNIVKLLILVAAIGYCIKFFIDFTSGGGGNGLKPPIESLYFDGKYKDVLEHYEGIEAAKPDTLYYVAEAHFNIADIFTNFYRSSYKDWIKYSNRLELAGYYENSKYIHFFTGVSHFEAGNFGDAVEYFNQAKRKDIPDDLKKISDFYIMVSNGRNGNASRAESQWQNCRRNAEAKPYLANYLGRLCIEADFHAGEADEFIKPNFRGDVDDLLYNENLLNAAFIYLKKNNSDRAAENLRNYDHHKPFYVENFETDDELLNKLGRRFYSPFFYKVKSQIYYKLAISEYTELSEKYPDYEYYLDAVFKTGESFYRLSDFINASEIWHGYLRSVENIDLDEFERYNKGMIGERIKECKLVLDNETIDTGELRYSDDDIIQFGRISELARICWEQDLSRDNVKIFFNRFYDIFKNYTSSDIVIFSDEQDSFFRTGIMNAVDYFLRPEIYDWSKANVLLSIIYNQGSQFSPELNQAFVLFGLSEATLNIPKDRSQSLVILNSYYDLFDEALIAFDIHQHLIEAMDNIRTGTN